MSPSRHDRPPRTLVHKLAAVVLGIESVVAFLVGLSIFRLGTLPEGVPAWWGIVVGVALALLMIATAGMIQRPFAIPFGWVLQLLVALTAFFLPAVLIVALVFGALWGYATIGGARIEARHASASTSTEPN